MSDIGRVMNGNIEPLVMIVCLKLKSNIFPRIRPSIIGAAEYFILSKMYPMIPNIKITMRSNGDWDKAYPPTTDNTAIIGMRYFTGTISTFVIGLASTIPVIHSAIVAQKIKAAIIAINPGF